MHRKVSVWNCKQPRLNHFKKIEPAKINRQKQKFANPRNSHQNKTKRFFATNKFFKFQFYFFAHETDSKIVWRHFEHSGRFFSSVNIITKSEKNTVQCRFPVLLDLGRHFEAEILKLKKPGDTIPANRGSLEKFSDPKLTPTFFRKKKWELGPLVRIFFRLQKQHCG